MKQETFSGLSKLKPLRYKTNQPTETVIDFDNDDGSDVLVVRNGEAKAIWIDGEKVYEYDDLYRGRLMRILDENTDGKISSYEEKEAVIDLTKGDGGAYVNWNLPEDLDNIVFSEDVDIVYVRTSDDLEALENYESEDTDYLIVRNYADSFSEDLIRRMLPEGVDVWDFQTR